MSPSTSNTQQASQQACHVKSSTPATVKIRYVLLALQLANHFLASEPRHVRFRESQRQSSSKTAKAGPQDQRGLSLKTHDSSSKASNSSITSRPCLSVEADAGRQYTHSASLHQYRAQTQSRAHHGHDRRQPNPSKAQQSEAWTRIRSVSRGIDELILNTNASTSDNPRRRVPKKVRWGHVQVYEYTHEDAGDEPASMTDHMERYSNAKQRHTGHRVQTTGLPQTASNVYHDSPSQQERWAPAPTGDEHEIWGPTAGSDGQMD